MAADGSGSSPFRSYAVVDGLSQSNVHDITQDQSGYLWIATARGLNRFDGKTFDHFTIADGLPNNWITSIYTGADNVVWTGDQRGNISKIDGSRVVYSVLPAAEQSEPILALAAMGDVILALVEGIGIVAVDKVDDIYASSLLVEDNSRELTNFIVKGNTVYVEATTGLYRLDSIKNSQLLLLQEDIRKIHLDSNGSLWAVDAHGNIGTYSDVDFDVVATLDAQRPIVGIAADRNGLIWAATEKALFGLHKSADFAESNEYQLTQYGGVDQVRAIFMDGEDSIWLSTGRGLVRFLGERFQHFLLRTTPDPVNVWSIGEDRGGRMWFGTHDRLLVREGDETLTVVGPDSGLPSGAVRDLVADGKGTVWAGVANHGLFAIDSDSLHAKVVVGTEGVEILDITIAVDEAVWFSTIGSGVFRYSRQGDSLDRFKAPNATSIYTIDAGSDGSIWYAADEFGLVQLIPDGEGLFTERHIVEPNGYTRHLYNHIRVTGESSAWVSTEEGGVHFYDNGALKNYGVRSPLADQTIYLIEPLENGSIVVGGEQGLYQFVPGIREFAHFDPQLGFIGMETNVHASFRDSSGGLWIGTVDGATRMDVTQAPLDVAEPWPSIVGVMSQLDGRRIRDGEELEPADFGANIEFGAISLLALSEVQYSHRLVGAEDEWRAPTTNRSVSYPKVLPGSYDFQVRARYEGGEWGEHIASHSFTVRPFFWQQPWFVMSLVVFALLAIRHAINYRTRKVNWLNDTLRAQVEERTRSIESARRSLELSNERLSQEVEARSELETRFRQAFENAPIGMGLLDAEGVIFDANPALANMFWSDVERQANRKFADCVSDADTEEFNENYKKVVCAADIDALNLNLACNGTADQELHTVVNLSAVRSESGEFLYTVLQIQDVTESLKLTGQLEYQASYDDLTELLNRRAFEAQLERAWKNGISGGKKSFLMFMDLDQFKVVNDTSGHTAGDQLLRAVSEILLDCVRSNDVVGRLGGDEFGIILWECPEDVAKRIAEAIRSRIESFRFHWDAEVYRIGVSIGGVPVCRSIGDINELQQLADAACYAAKEAGRNRVHMVDGASDSARLHRGEVRWVQRIREAMDKNRFAIYAQPIHSIIKTPGEPERLEILLRLRDPKSKKLIPPGAFLPAAERYGLSVELDKWVVRSLLDTLFIHNAFRAENRSYWINLSGSSVGDKRFAEFLVAAIERSPLPRGTINFEITETAVIRSVSEAGKLMAALREMGCQFALDDFGSGLSSFGYLKKLPVDYIKIDGMFIRDLLNDHTDRIFVKSIIDIARSLNIKTIAEFVESDEILEIVTELGAGYAQGFAVGRPFELAPRFPNTANSDFAIIDAKTG